MPLVDLPNNVWTRMFSFLAPPLPFIGTEDRSIAEDAKAWRGDLLAKGQWKDIDALMLVSKRLNELAEPIFWSNLVLSSGSRARWILGHWLSRVSSNMRRKSQSVKVLQLHDVSLLDDDPDNSSGYFPVLHLLTMLPSIVHLHVRSDTSKPVPQRLLTSLVLRCKHHPSLEGVTGLVVADCDHDILTIMLRTLAPSLQRLSISSVRSKTSPFGVFGRLHAVDLPALVAFAVGSSLADDEADRLEENIFGLWKMPLLEKLVIGVNADGTKDQGSGLELFDCERDEYEPVERVFIPDLLGLADDGYASVRAKELAMGFDTNTKPLINLKEYTETLEKAYDPKVTLVESVVGVQSPSKSAKINARHHMLVELVNLRRMPTLKKVVWVSAVKGDAGALWPAILIQWVLDLIKAGVEFEIQ